MIRGTNGSEAEVGFARAVFLVRLKAGRDVEETQVVYVQFMESTPLLDEVDLTSAYVIV